MISKTKALKVLTATCLAWPFSASAYDPYQCLRELMPITTHGTLRPQRKGVEQPFMVSNFVVFPEVADDKVTGFYVYAPKKAWFYDSVAGEQGPAPIRSLKTERGVLDLVAQPNGLETVSIPYLPGFNPRESDKDGPAVLGASVLPVVGAVFSRPARPRAVYNNPIDARENEVRIWLSQNGKSRLPASDAIADRTILRLLPGERADIWRPLKSELELRRRWVQNNNLDESAFRELTRAMQGSCRQ